MKRPHIRYRFPSKPVSGRFVIVRSGWILICCISILTGVPVSAGQVETGGLNMPACLHETVLHVEPSHDGGYLTDLFLYAMSVYSKHLSPAISRGCPSHPSCSQYMQQAVLEIGLPLGLIAGIGRLLHESGEIHYGTIIHTGQGYRLYDPLENNTFWWKSRHAH